MKNKVALLTNSISRNAGGLFSAINPLTTRLGDGKFDVSIFSARDSFTNQDVVAWKNTNILTSSILGPKSFGYQRGIFNRLISGKFDLFHIHGLWMFPSYVGSKLGKYNLPYVISPHGMLDPWALNNSKWKKRIAYILYEHTNLSKSSCIHALCYEEYLAIRALGLNNPVAIIPNGVDIPFASNSNVPDWRVRLKNDKNNMLYLGRIHPKKGLENLIMAWKKSLSMSNQANSWNLLIAGWGDSVYLEKLKLLIQYEHLEGHVHFIGPQFDDEKAKTFSSVSSFILPSLSEGMPMVILEAWSNKIPVLMSKFCNLNEAFLKNAAIEIDTEIDSMSISLCDFFSMDFNEQINIGENGYRLVKDKYTWDIISDKTTQLYDWIINNTDKPDFVILD